MFREHRCLELTLQRLVRLLMMLLLQRYSIKIGADSTDLRAGSTKVGADIANITANHADLGPKSIDLGADNENLELKVRSLS